MRIFLTIVVFISIIFELINPINLYSIGLIENEQFVIPLDSLPEDFPPVEINKQGTPSTGYYFISTLPQDEKGNLFGNYNMIIDNDGLVKAYKRIGKDLDTIPMNFVQSYNGFLVHTEKAKNTSTIFVSDTALSKQDSISNHGIITSTPYLEVLPNGHYLKVNYSSQYLDISNIIDGADPNSVVLTADIMELDKNKDIVMFWRALDYLKINDTYSISNKFNDLSVLDYQHTNSIEYDYDGNILVSNGNLSEILKINRQTGEIIWRLGGTNNEFQFIDEKEENSPTYFSSQHDIRRLANGNITLFDNGNQHPIQVSRAVEYKLDEVNKTCNLVWDYIHESNIFSKDYGSVHRQPNGNTVISWGDASWNGLPSMTEVDKDKNKILEITLPYGYNSTGINKFPWAYSSPSSRVSFEILKGNTYIFNKGSQITCTQMKINDLQEIFYPMIFVNKYLFAPQNPEFEEPQAPIIHPVRLLATVRGLISVNVEARFNLSCLGITYNPQDWKVYRRDNPGKGVFVQIETNYDESTGELVVNTSDYGEFIFGIPQTEIKPKETLLIFPVNNERINQNEPVNLSWSPHGYFTNCNLQIAENESFETLVLDTANLKAIDFEFSQIKHGQTYWWRVSSDNGNTNGDWSEVRKFTTVPEFIDISIPDGGENWHRDSLRKIIRWDKNISGKVRIELFKNDILYHLIKDTLFSPVGAYSWIIPDFIPFDSTYKIRVISISDETVIGESDDYFSIVDPATGLIDFQNGISGFELNQNSPNPFSRKTQFEFQIPKSGKVILSVYNMIGEKVETVLDKELAKGYYNINWDASNLISGQFYYRLQIGELSLTKTMTIIK